MRTILTIRLLDTAGQLIGWRNVQAEAKGDGCLWSLIPTIAITCERAGRFAAVSVHWPDVHVEARLPYGPADVVPGQTISVTLTPLLKVGEPPLALPPVPVREPVSIGLPVGSMGLRVN